MTNDENIVVLPEGQVVDTSNNEVLTSNEVNTSEDTPSNGSKPALKTWTLKEFKSLKGKCALEDWENKQSGEFFSTLVFRDPMKRDSLCFVGFSKKLGRLTEEQILAQVDDLYVIETEQGNYKLCREDRSSHNSKELNF